MLSGLARDGGLYVPEAIPPVRAAEIAAMPELSFEDAAFWVMRRYIGDCFTDTEFRNIIARAYEGFGHPARCPLTQIDTNEWVLELHHGPTLAFKDVAMQLIGQMFEVVLKRRGERLTIVCATSGDTGSAAVEAFAGLDSVDLFVLFPEGRVSEVQRRQMTTPAAANVHALAVQGHFDDCQALVKGMFNDFTFRDEVNLAGVNSINWARVLAQVVYYFTSAVALGSPHRPVSFSVPTGNFGDIFAGQVARRMGLPIHRLVIATNENDILHRMLETGVYAKQGVTATISPSMDIQVSSNFERLLYELYDNDGDAVAQSMAELAETGRFELSQGSLTRMREGFDSASADGTAAKQVIARVAREAGHVLDPHTAVGVAAAEICRGDRSVPMITLGTAHAAKFPDAVEQACGIRPTLPTRMAKLFERPERVSVVPNDLAEIEAMVRRERRT